MTLFFLSLLVLPKWPVCLASGLVCQTTCHRPAPPRTLTWGSSHHKEVLHHHMLCRVYTLCIKKNSIKHHTSSLQQYIFFLLSSGLGMYESPLFLATHEEESGGRSVPTTPSQVAAPGICLCLSQSDMKRSVLFIFRLTPFSTQFTVSVSCFYHLLLQ